MIIYIWKVITQEKDSIEKREHLVGFIGSENSNLQNVAAKFEGRPYKVISAEFIGIVSVAAK